MTDVAAQHLFAEALPQAAAYAENPEGWLVLTGPSGSGKTHLAAAIANRCIERQQTAFFIMVPDLLDHLRGAYSPSSEISYDELFDQVRNAPMLVLDDFGAHSSTPWAQEKLFQVVSHRHNNSLPTVVTVRGPLTRLDESIRTRLEAGERSTVLQLGHFNSRLALGIGEVRPEMLSRMTFDNFDVAGGLGATRKDQEELARALHAAQTFATFPEGWMLFTGSRGSGKTHLAVAVAGESKRQGRQVFFAFVPTLLDHLRMTFSPDSPVGFDDLFEQVLNSQLLVLDDLGAENSTPWAEEKLYQIVVYRHEMRLPTVITVRGIFPDLPDAVASRLKDQTLVHLAHISAPDFRDSDSRVRHGGQRTQRARPTAQGRSRGGSGY
jgi:DNA replication protein DnaC